MTQRQKYNTIPAGTPFPRSDIWTPRHITDGVACGDTVEKIATATNGKASAREEIPIDWTFDFANVSTHELCVLASRDLLIKCRTAFRDLPKNEISDAVTHVYSVREIIDGRRTKKTQKPVTVADVSTAFDALTDVERAAILAKYQQ